jgi:hypothetical protein
MYEITRFDATAISSKILSSLEEEGLSKHMIFSQCFDGANVMSGEHGGVRKKISEAVGRDVPYVHCCNHKLHLVIVHVCEKIPSVQQFYDYCQILTNFLNLHAVKQVYQGTKLARLLSQRWDGHHRTTFGIFDNFDELLEVLDFFSSGNIPGAADRAVTASGLLTTFLSVPRYLIVGILMSKILTLVKPVNRMLQSKSACLSDAVLLVKSSMAEIRELRSDAAFDAVSLHINDLRVKVSEFGSLPQPQSKRRRKMTATLNDSVIMSTLGTSSCDGNEGTSNLRQVFFEIVDMTTKELESRFSDFNCELVVSIDALIPANGDCFLDAEKMEPLIHLVSISSENSVIRFSEKSLQHEIPVARKLVMTSPGSKAEKLDVLADYMYRYKDAFPQVFTVICCALLLPASSATCEASFSTLTRLLTPYRKSMNVQRKQDLALLAYEKEETKQVSSEDLLPLFKENTRRLCL